MSKIYVIGFGPGGKGDMTFRASEAIQNSDVIFGYTTYIDLLKEIFPDLNYKNTGMTKEIDRCRMALEEAERGSTVAVVSSGDSGLYGMAGIMYQIAQEKDSKIDIEIIPGITAGCSAAAILGAPLMHDTAFISLSTCLTDWCTIERRLDAAASGDMVIVLYNPKSKKRTDLLNKAFEIIGKYRSGDTPVGVVRNIGRKDESHWISTISVFDFNRIDMFCTVIVGNSNTYERDGKMITPRGYEKRM